MRLLIRYINGSVGAAILIATIGNRLRVAVPGNEDIVEFRQLEGQWLAENGQAVAIEFDPGPDEFSRWADVAMAPSEPFCEPTQFFNRAPQTYAAYSAPVN